MDIVKAESVNSFKNRLDKHWGALKYCTNFMKEWVGVGGIRGIDRNRKKTKAKLQKNRQETDAYGFERKAKG